MAADAACGWSHEDAGLETSGLHACGRGAKMVQYALIAAAALLAIGPIALTVGGTSRGGQVVGSRGRYVVYGLSLAASVALVAIALAALLGGTPSTARLPLALPWAAAHSPL